MKILYSVTGILLALVLVAVGFAYSGLYDVSASSPHGGVVSWLLSVTSHASVERRARNLDVPNLADERLRLAGAGDFDAMCSSCHGAPGQEPQAVGLGLNPAPPDLQQSARHMTPAELFWVTKHGIRMTGMPAWGATHDDEALWPVVAFMTELPDLDAPAYQAMLEQGAGLGHHGTGEPTTHDHAEPQSHEHPDSPDTKQQPEAPPGHEDHDHSH